MKKWALVTTVAYMVLINILLVGSPAEYYFTQLPVHFSMAVVIFLVVWRKGGVKKWALVPSAVFILLTIISGSLSGNPAVLVGLVYSLIVVQIPIAVVIFLMVWGIGSLGRRLVERH